MRLRRPKSDNLPRELTRRGTRLVLAVVVMAELIAAIAAQDHVSAAQQREATPAPVFLANVDIPKGLPGYELIARGYAKQGAVRLGSRPARALTNLDDIRGEQALAPLRANTILVTDQFGGHVTQPTLPSLPAEPGPPIAVTLTVSPPAVRAAQLVVVTIRAASDVGGLVFHGITWGDGTITPAPRYTGPVGSGRPASHFQVPGPQQLNFGPYGHFYRRAGWYRVAATFTHGSSSCGKPNSAICTGSFRVHVIGPNAASNGPLFSDPAVGIYGITDGAFLGDLSSYDPDGYIRSMTIDWGDKTSKRTFANHAACIDTATTWPSSYVWLRPITHHYRPGLYRIRTTMISTGCDGKSSRTTTELVTVRVTETSWTWVGSPILMPPQPSSPPTLDIWWQSACPESFTGCQQTPVS